MEITEWRLEQPPQAVALLALHAPADTPELGHLFQPSCFTQITPAEGFHEARYLGLWVFFFFFYIYTIPKSYISYTGVTLALLSREDISKNGYTFSTYVQTAVKMRVLHRSTYQCGQLFSAFLFWCMEEKGQLRCVHFFLSDYLEWGHLKSLRRMSSSPPFWRSDRQNHATRAGL